MIIGRNADFILKSRDNVLNVFIRQYVEKVQRVCKLYNVNESDAVKMINDTDKRQNELQFLYGSEMGNGR